MDSTFFAFKSLWSFFYCFKSFPLDYQSFACIFFPVYFAFSNALDNLEMHFGSMAARLFRNKEISCQKLSQIQDGYSEDKYEILTLSVLQNINSCYCIL